MTKYTNKTFDFENNYVRITYLSAQLINNLHIEDKQKILECKTQSERMRLVISYLQNYSKQNIVQNNSIAGSTSIKKNPMSILEDKVTNSVKMTEEAKSIARKDIERLKTIHNSSPEYDSLYSYVDTLVNLPWDNSNPEVIDIKKAQV